MSLTGASEPLELTILMPCLNEAETLATCIAKAIKGIANAGVTGEVLIADNGSTDGSIDIALKSGARVEHVKVKGYGNALRGGIAAAQGRWIIMGDADDSYDFSNIGGFVEKLRAGNDLVMGCRLPVGGGTIVRGAMPWKNRWIGNPILSFIGRLFFRTPIHDFHCGLRGFSADGYRRMELNTTGMEYASEMVIKSQLKGLRMAEVPITLHPDGRSRPPHLKPWRDGWRHLRFMLLFSPVWLFFIPGLVLMGLGMAFSLPIVAFGQIHLGPATLDVGTLLVASFSFLLGFQWVAQAMFAKRFVVAQGLMPASGGLSRILHSFSLERGVVVGVLIGLAGFTLLFRCLWAWKAADFGPLQYTENLRSLIPAVTLLMMGLQLVSASFQLGVLDLKTNSTPA